MANRNPKEVCPGGFEALAKFLAKERDRAKKALLTGFAQCFKARDGIEKANFCPATLAGIAADMVEAMDDADYLARMRERGEAILAGIVLPEREARVGTLQVISIGEPDAVLRDLLSQSGFRRHAGTDVALEIYVGAGSLATWKKLQSHRVTVAAITLPGGLSLEPISAGNGQAMPTPILDARLTTGGTASDNFDGAGEPTSQDPSDKGDAMPAETAFRPYRMAQVSAPDERDWALHRAKPAQYEALMDSVVAQEGPINLDAAVESVRRSLGLGSIHENSRAKLKAAVTKLAADGRVLVLDGDFFHKPGLPILPRDRTGCPARIRTLAAVSEAEITAALLEVLGADERGDDDAVLMAAARRLGYVLKSPNTNRALAERLSAATTALIEASSVTRDDRGRLILVPNPSDMQPEEDRSPAADASSEEPPTDLTGDVISFPGLNKGG
ncbi:hypothetical protein [Methylobacterium gnaphalii]|uniref:Uncharacterized protein n=1 Tax=Methylobacterium gnaphalii TaxID=1010610 RepID=A0A512JR83_9HYPH|nr:hypothetical protein [Methylobacterium gnaphalii]GEP12461.1 hypothetical protein MGN01_43060 [Methylobacterium gnaphalii]GJD71527.1 hypothetical protein MMMDOFMJ_4488 [Methylobacterium gnaphalii]GLS49785.1 hypothetical protein GCM10007885_26360 [Methylobacterium gnaphalii]